MPRSRRVPSHGAGCALGPCDRVDSEAGTSLVYHPDLYLDSVVITALLAGFIGSIPWLKRVQARHGELDRKGAGALQTGLDVVALCSMMLVFFCSALELSAGPYNPFIYFRC